jgi:hypothetical protein
MFRLLQLNTTILVPDANKSLYFLLSPEQNVCDELVGPAGYVTVIVAWLVAILLPRQINALVTLHETLCFGLN